MSVEKIAGVVRDYAWGTPGGIDRVRGIAPSSQIQAEWWLGDHPQGMATVERTGEPLSSWLASFGDGQLGFLLKVLTPATPLSLQVHPTTAQAQEGFDREELLGVAPDSPTRVFRDRSAKPELIVSFGGVFDALAGNASDEDVVAHLNTLVEAGYPKELADAWREKLAAGRSATVQWLLGDSADALAVVAGLGDVANSHPLLGVLWEHYPGDPGCAVGLMLNRVAVEPGEALFVEAGEPHAYLAGVGIELMAPSDNVLRGGLTPKHIDIDQLLAIASFEPSPPPRLTPIVHSDTWREYRPPHHGFALHRVVVGEGKPRVDVSMSLPAICLSVEGGAVVSVDGLVTQLATGEAAVVAGHGNNTQVAVLQGSAVWIAHRR